MKTKRSDFGFTHTHSVLFTAVVLAALVMGLMPLYGSGTQAQVNQVISSNPVRISPEIISKCKWLNDGYLYTAFKVVLAPGSTYTFELQYPATEDSYGYALLKSNPFDPNTPQYFFSKSIQNRPAPNKGYRINKTRFTVDSAASGRVAYVLISSYVGNRPVNQVPAKFIIRTPADQGVDQPQVVPGWEELGPQYIYDDSGLVSPVEN